MNYFNQVDYKLVIQVTSFYSILIFKITSKFFDSISDIKFKHLKL